MTISFKTISSQIGVASLASIMLLSSCSKEDTTTLSPQPVPLNGNSSLKEIKGVYNLYHLSSTDGPTCIGCVPNTHWYLKNPSRDATSSLTAYAGNSLRKWVKPLPVPETGPGSIITVVSDIKHSGNVYAFIKNLVKGKKYKLAFSVSTTSLSGPYGPSPYAEKGIVTLSANVNYMHTVKTFDFTNKKDQWLTGSIEFVAVDDDYTLRFQGISKEGEPKLTYANFHLGENALQEIN